MSLKIKDLYLGIREYTSSCSLFPLSWASLQRNKVLTLARYGFGCLISRDMTFLGTNVVEEGAREGSVYFLLP